MVVCERVCGGNGEFTSDWDPLASFLSLAALVKTGNIPLSTQLHNCTTAILNSYLHIHTTVNYGCSSTIHNQDHVTCVTLLVQLRTNLALNRAGNMKHTTIHNGTEQTKHFGVFLSVSGRWCRLGAYL